MSGCHKPECLSTCCDNIKDSINDLRNRVSCLELEMKAKEFGVQMKEGNRFMECLSGLELKLLDRIKELERFQDITHLEYKANRKPHKCPVCGGSCLNPLVSVANVKKDFEFYREYASCTACEGKGIVWG